MKLLGLGLVVLGSASLSCVELGGWYGVQIDPACADTLVPGRSTLADAIAALGAKPSGVSTDETGVTTAEWSRVSGRLSDPETLRCDYQVIAHFDPAQVLIDVIAEDYR